ncbi:MAG: PAS domain-containing protein [Campylobacterota bacterium]|nr:PAS domain-containing protein [Campylobacterota bacterium]
MTRPDPVNEEIVLDPKQYIVSKTDRKGVIEYGNEYFVEISGYKESELIGTPHNLIRHPDMPKVAFKMMWERILKGENFIAIVKNLAKDGRYY